MVEPLEELYDEFNADAFDVDGRALRSYRYGHRYCKYKKHGGSYYRKLTVNETEVDFEDEEGSEVRLKNTIDTM